MFTDVLAEVKKAGVEFDHHYSDLYIPMNDTTRKILDNYEYAMLATTFKDAITGKIWYDIPFGYYEN